MYDPKYLGYKRIRDLFHHNNEIVKFCKLDNADNTTLVVTYDKATKSPPWEEIKDKIVKLVEKHQHDQGPNYGYRLDLQTK